MSDPHARIAELEAELAAVRHEMQDFTYAVSHDLRAPLRHIVSYARLVEEDAGPLLSEEVQGFLSTITASATQLGTMLDGLRELSRVGMAPLQWSSVRVNDLLEELLQAQDMPTLHVEWRIDSDLGIAWTDVGLLRGALGALLDNAVKFSQGQPRPVIDIACLPDQAPSAFSLCVRDNGMGLVLPNDVALGKPFQRFHANTGLEGVGLGLARTFKAMQRLGGGLRIESAVGDGCCTVLTGLRRVPPAHQPTVR